MKRKLMGPRQHQLVPGGDFEAEVETFYARLGKEENEPAFCEGYTEEDLRLHRLIPRSVRLLGLYLLLGFILAGGAGLMLWTSGSVLLREHGITFRLDECIREARWNVVLLTEWGIQMMDFGIGLLPPMLTLPWAGRKRRLAAMVLFNQSGAAVVTLIRATVLYSTRCNMTHVDSSTFSYSELCFVLTTLGTTAIGCYPYGLQSYILMLSSILLGIVPGWLSLFILVPLFESVTGFRRLLLVSMVQGFFFLPRVVMPRIARSFYMIVPAMKPCRTYAMGAPVAFVGAALLRLLQSGLDSKQKFGSAILSGSIELAATVASPYIDAAISILMSREIAVPPVTFFSPYRRRALADIFSLMDVFECAAIVFSNLVWPITLMLIFGSLEHLREALPDFISDALTVLGIHSLFTVASLLWAMKVDNLPLARARLGERRCHFVAVATGVWVTVLAYTLFHENIVVATCEHIGVNLTELGYLLPAGEIEH